MDDAHTVASRLERILPILRCPETGAPLVREGEGLRAVGGGPLWPLVAGRPALATGVEAQVMDPGHRSHGLPPQATELIEQANGLVLQLSGGGTPQRYENVVEAEFAVFRHTDVVADVHHLPFADHSFAGVLSLNAFEHYAEPAKAAAEILRVLRPGGKVLVHTAFLQPVHEAPYHFYNATRYGLERWFAGFETVDLKVTNNFNPMNALAWIATEARQILAEGVSEEAAQRFSAMTVDDLIALWANSGRREDEVWQSFMKAPQAALERIAAGFEFVGRKPG